MRDPGQIELYIDPLSRVDAEVIILAKEQKADLVLTRECPIYPENPPILRDQ